MSIGLFFTFILHLFLPNKGEFQHSPVTVHQTNSECGIVESKQDTCSIDKHSEQTIDVNRGNARVSFDLETKAGTCENSMRA